MDCRKSTSSSGVVRNPFLTTLTGLIDWQERIPASALRGRLPHPYTPLPVGEGKWVRAVCCILKQLSAFGGYEMTEPIVPIIQPRAGAAGGLKDVEIAVDAQSIPADLREIELGKAHQVDFVDHHSR
jgi:hypothetical protein